MGITRDSLSHNFLIPKICYKVAFGSKFRILHTYLPGHDYDQEGGYVSGSC